MKKTIGSIIIGAVTTIGLFIISRYNYLLFHSIAELYKHTHRRGGISLCLEYP